MRTFLAKIAYIVYGYSIFIGFGLVSEISVNLLVEISVLKRFRFPPAKGFLKSVQSISIKLKYFCGLFGLMTLIIVRVVVFHRF